MAGETPHSYSNVVAFLATAGVLAPLVKRLKISPILGFLAAGVALGPHALGRFAGDAPWLAYFTVSRPEQIHDVAELGVVFLLFSIGLELSWERLRVMRRQVFGLGALQTLGCGALIGAAALAMKLPFPAAAAIGAALAMSSTAVTLPVMAEAGRLQSAPGRSVFSILLFQDLAVAPILIAIGLLSGNGSVHPLAALGTAVFGLVGIVVAGRLLLRPLFRSAARAKSQELFMAASLLVIIGAGLSAELLGLSMALGAFVAGLLLAETEFRHEIDVLIGPFRDLLLGLFFVSVGIGLNLSLLAEAPGLILGAAAGFVALKALMGAGLAPLVGLRGGQALEVGLTIAAGGEFAFVILGQASQAAHLLPAPIAQAITVSATISMFAIPGLVFLGARLGRAQGAADGAHRAAPPPSPDAKPRALIVGYGRVGQLVGEMLGRHDVAWTAIDRDFRAVEAARAQGHEVWFGDASRPELLERCGLAHAPGVVLTTDEPEAAEAVTAAVRRLRPDVVLVARARDARHARRLYEIGATDAVPETIEASLQLSEAVLVSLGVPMGFVIASVHDKRDEIRRSLNPSPPKAEGTEATPQATPVRPRRRAPRPIVRPRGDAGRPPTEAG
jgi:CPA2 family monovalent cation:H+ antiporter-2